MFVVQQDVMPITNYAQWHHHELLLYSFDLNAMLLLSACPNKAATNAECHVTALGRQAPLAEVCGCSSWLPAPAAAADAA